MTTALVPVNNVDEARKACERHIIKYGDGAAPDRLEAILSTDRFAILVAKVERTVTGEHALHSLDAAMDDAVVWTLGVIKSLPSRMQRELLYGNEPIEFNHGSFGV